MDLARIKPPAPPLAEAEHFLARIDVLIDWAALEANSTADHAEERVPPAALKIALLKQWYGFSDQEAQFHILDRLSFRSFLGFAGDASTADAEILNELSEGMWARHTAMAGALERIEEQLRALGYAVRSGELRDPSLAPCTESGEPLPEARTTSMFRPGELGRMVEAVTAKAHAEGITPATSQDRLKAPAAPLAPVEPAAPSVRGVPSAPAEQPIRAVLEWPWGQRSELSEHLNIGRDYTFSPLARELTPYTHVSRKHAELLVYGDGVWVRDLGSRNGTYVNNDEVPKGQAYLIDGDSIIRFGPLLAASLKIVA
ncbi:MAG: FHA domain-containing protein [Burkholderiales bacterium]|nr:FHA domain-containing protein [Burkholderiales bacterium]